MKNFVRFILQTIILGGLMLTPFYIMALMEKSKEFTFIVIVLAIKMGYDEIKDSMEG